MNGWVWVCVGGGGCEGWWMGMDVNLGECGGGCFWLGVGVDGFKAYV